MDDSAPAPANPPQSYACPHCGQAVSVTLAPTAQRWTCPSCGDEFLVAAIDGSTERSDSTTPPDDLDVAKIHQLSTARRTTIRIRSYWTVAAIACTVGMVQAACNLVRHIAQSRFDHKAFAFAAIILALGAAAFYCARQAMRTHRQLRSLATPDPDTPPDFSKLSDGSQYWRNLQRLTDDPQQRQQP